MQSLSWEKACTYPVLAHLLIIAAVVVIFAQNSAFHKQELYAVNLDANTYRLNAGQRHRHRNFCRMGKKQMECLFARAL